MSPDVLYNTIGAGYNSTRRADAYITERLYYLLSPVAKAHYLDIGCGTGNYTIALAEKDLAFTGIDPSEKMLAEARLKNNSIQWLAGSAEQIPASDAEFSGAIGTLTLHHWKNPQQAFTEVYRVLKPGAKFVLFTSTPQQMQGYWLNHYFPEMLHNSILQMPEFEIVEKAAEKTGFAIATVEKYFVKEDLQDGFLYIGKHHPSLYFDENIRRGISSFAALANASEVATGLEKLHSDVRSGRFEKIKNSYTNDAGDYLFIALEKTA